MRTVSENYISYINSSRVRRPKSKFVVDDIHYKGDQYLISYPKVEHKTDTAIGSFPAKTCELEILNRNGTFDLHGKEVTVYRGLDIGGTTEWVRIGVFTASDDNIKTNINKQTITFKGTDKTQLLDKPYGGAAQWDVSKRVLHIVKDICDRNGIALATSLFPLNDYIFPDIPPGLDFDNITERQMIAYIAELSGSIAMFTHNGKLIFAQENETGVTIPKTKYKTLSVENPIGPINAISFGHATYEDALLYTQEGVTDSTKVEWAINDNPLTTTKDRKNLIQRISGYFFGRSFTPFELDGIIDDYIFDLNDTVTIEKKNGDTVKVTLLEMMNTSRIKSRFGASLQTPGKTKTALAGSIKERLGKVEFIVDHQQNSISALIKDAEGKQTAINANAEGLKAQAVATQNLTEKYNQLSNDFSNLDIAGTVTTEVQKETTLELIAGKVEAKVSANYASKSDLGDYVKNEALSTAITATESKITEEAKRIAKIEQAGYITETEAQGLIDLSSESIAMSVKKDIKIGTRNILLDSACFGSFTPTGYASQEIAQSTHSYDTYPSGKLKRILIQPASNATQYGYVGAIFKNPDILGETVISKIKTDTVYTLSFWIYDYLIPTGEQRKLSKSYLVSAGANASVEYLTTTDPSITKAPQKIVVTFKITGTISQFNIGMLREYKSGDSTVDMRLSSIKLEEGNIATDWTPNQTELANAVQSAKASIDIIDGRITEEAKRITQIEKAGYITETEAQGLIDLSSESIAMSVKKDIKIGTRNILLDSACFESFTPTGYASQEIAQSTHSYDTYPSGKLKRISIKPASNATQYGYVGAIFKNPDILGETEISKIKTDTVYTLSFWLYDYLIPTGEQRKLSKSYLVSAGANASVEYLTTTEPSITKAPQKIVVTFKITGTISQFNIGILREYKSGDLVVDMRLSSIKLEEGNIATDWTPNQTELANAVQSAEAKLELCVQTDENGNLKSAIHAKANQITIESDNFTIDSEGNMTCNNAQITGGKLFSGDEDRNIVIEKGRLIQNYGGEKILELNVETAAYNPEQQTNITYSQLEYLNGIRFFNGKGGAIDISRYSWGYSDKIDALERDVIRSRGGLVIDANNRANALLLAGTGVWICGKLYMANYRNSVSDRTPLYVNSSGEITI